MVITPETRIQGQVRQRGEDEHDVKRCDYLRVGGCGKHEMC